MNDDDGMRIVRGHGKRPRYAQYPTNLLECAEGKVVLICVRVGTHLAGVGNGEYSDTMLRPYDFATSTELHRADMYIKNAHLVTVYEPEME